MDEWPHRRVRQRKQRQQRNLLVCAAHTSYLVVRAARTATCGPEAAEDRVMCGRGGAERQPQPSFADRESAHARSNVWLLNQDMLLRRSQQVRHSATDVLRRS